MTHIILPHNHQLLIWQILGVVDYFDFHTLYSVFDTKK